jgi:hypothetical protein
MTLETTIESPVVWSNVVAIGSVVLLALYVFHLQRAQKQLIYGTADVVTSYHNQLAVCEDQLADVSAKYLRLKTGLDEEMEAELSGKQAQPKSQTASISSGKSTGNSKDTGAAGPTAASPTEQQLRDEMTKLKQQAARDGTTISSLRQQNVTLSRRLEEEQQKNRKLSGE